MIFVGSLSKRAGSGIDGHLPSIGDGWASCDARPASFVVSLRDRAMKGAACVIGNPDIARNDMLTQQLSAVGLEIAHWIGVFPASGDCGALANQRAAKIIYGRDLTLGEIGCWHSHRGAYEWALQAHLDYLFVLEDDAWVDPGTLTPLLDAVEAVLAEATPRIVSLFTHSDVSVDAGRVGSTNRLVRQLNEDEEVPVPERLMALSRPPRSTVAYFINSEACRVALRSPAVAVTSADWPTWAPDVEFWLAPQSGVRHGRPLLSIDAGHEESPTLMGAGRHSATLVSRIAGLAVMI